MNSCRVLWMCAAVFLYGCASCKDDPNTKNNGSNNANNGTASCAKADCDANASCDDSSGVAVCTCAPGYQGDGRNCSQVTTACETDADCGAHGRCIADECECDDGYAPDGTTCADADECATNTDDCDERATCINTDGSHACTCEGGYTGDGYTCLDFNECAANAHDCTTEHSECVNVDGGFECGCEAGYTGDGRSCSVLVDCNANPNACDANASCTETPDGTACVCDAGFKGDGATCRQAGFEYLTASVDGTCGVRRDGTVACWGFGTPSSSSAGLIYEIALTRPTPEPSGSTWAHFAGGGGRYCGIREDGAMFCSSGNSMQQVGTDSDWATVAPHNGYGFDAFACAIRRNGTLWCWGENGEGQLGNGTRDSSMDPVQVGTDSDWEHVRAAQEHACATKTDGTFWCWGNGSDGRFGDSVSESLVPTQIGSATDWELPIVGGRFVCGLKTNGRVECSGRIENTGLPTAGDSSTWRAFDINGLAGRWCGVKTDGSLWCQGSNLWGESGSDGPPTSLELQRVGDDTDWRSVVASVAHTCALREDGAAWCFGHNMLGQLGIGNNGIKPTPAQVLQGTSFLDMTLGQAHTCGVSTAGTLHCTGSNLVGLSGHPAEILHVQSMTRVGQSTNWRKVAAGVQHTCAVQGDGTLWCMGFNGGGQVGIGLNVAPAPGPNRVGQASNWTDVESGAIWNVGRTQTGQISFWGLNGTGQHGSGDKEPAYTPTQTGADTWKTASTGGGAGDYGHSCAIRASDDTLWCWGANGQYELGDGTTVESLVPKQIGSAKWTSVDCGSDYTCGIQADGSLWCWGGGLFGKLGIGPNSRAEQPTQVGTDRNWRQISAGVGVTCGVRTDNTLWCWGDATAGQLGNGDPALGVAYTPLRVGTANNWDRVETNHTHTCAIKTDGSLWCWGINRDGQLGTGDAWSAVPREVLD